MKEIENYVEAFERIEERIVDDNKFPVVKDSKIKRCCRVALDFTKLLINYIDAIKEKRKYQNEEAINP